MMRNDENCWKDETNVKEYIKKMLHLSKTYQDFS